MPGDIYEKFRSGIRDEEDLRRNRAMFRELFLTPTGQYVLGRMLDELKFLDQCENERDMALSNFAKGLLITIYYDETNSNIDSHGIINFVKKQIRRLHVRRKR